MATETTVTFSGKRAAEIVGITYRQLDYWARTDLIRPSVADASGQRQPAQVRLRRPARAAHHQAAARRRHQARVGARRVRRAPRASSATTSPSANLVIEGSSVALALDDGELLDLLKQGQGVLNVMSLGQCKDELDARIVSLHESDPVEASVGHHPTSVAR